VLLRSVDFGEADRVVTLLTERFGRIAVMARGARKSQRRFGASLEPFAVIEAAVALGSGEVSRLAEARVIRAFPRLLGNLEAMREAGRALELVRRVAPQREGEPRLVACAEQLFEELDGAVASGGSIRGAFARCGLRALAVVGLAPRLDVCVGCGRSPEPGQAALFDAGRGSIVCRSCGGGSLRLSGRARAWMIAASGDATSPPGEIVDAGDVEAAIDAFVARHAPG